MDALSQALAAVRMTGAIFVTVECGSPWGFAVPAIADVAHVLAPDAERLVGYHLVTEGHARIRIGGAHDLEVGPGDVVVVPHGEAHVVSHGVPATIVDSRAALGDATGGPPRAVRIGGGGTPARIVCGFFGCERRAERLFLSGLPPVFKVGLRDDDAGRWLEATVCHLVDEAAAARPGSALLLAKLAEVLFVEALRRHVDATPQTRSGWLAAAGDPLVGRAIARLHREPARRWTVARLASEVGASQSVLRDRFVRVLGEPPLSYLSRWRLQLAARGLETSDANVIAIATDVGYQSEASFNRAFKREFGVPPAQYRRRHRAHTRTAIARRSAR